MRVYFITKQKIVIAIIICISFLTAAVHMEAKSVNSRFSPETRDYWLGSKDIVWHIETKEKMIALTFDDGPSPTFTPQILDILKKNGVRATFFVIAKEAEKYPEIVKRMVMEGHEIANHTYHHTYPNRLSEDELKEELILAEEAIMKAGGRKPKLFRPPGGYYNEMIVKTSKSLGYTVVIWSWEQQSRDWANPGISVIANTVLKNASSGNIVVFHDRGGDRMQTVRALGPVIQGLREKGFKMATVSGMIKGSK